MSEQLPPPCDLCAPNDGAWRETPEGLKRCICDRGKMLLGDDIRRSMTAKAKAQKAAEKDRKAKEAKRKQAVARRRSDRAMAAKYGRDLPMFDGGER